MKTLLLEASMLILGIFIGIGMDIGDTNLFYIQGHNDEYLEEERETKMYCDMCNTIFGHNILEH